MLILHKIVSSFKGRETEVNLRVSSVVDQVQQRPESNASNFLNWNFSRGKTKGCQRIFALKDLLLSLCVDYFNEDFVRAFDFREVLHHPLGKFDVCT